MKRYKTHRFDPSKPKSRTSEWRERKKEQLKVPHSEEVN